MGYLEEGKYRGRDFLQIFRNYIKVFFYEKWLKENFCSYLIKRMDISYL